ncbi:basic proline-rich protein-like isoform X1 [Canis lupus familiaris]|uniref:basic proline-rich protein-like isoform X1 n=1 Tax=Canis lupus familiaris TaxID=9615 RepID=UPI0018F7002D|nr:basic proline-rich protein-like isoform X1 [Canis lupus familiaris]XP_038528947.1 basic proline-rich protein-like isoform X1 [Canis lupus familiaris]
MQIPANRRGLAPPHRTARVPQRVGDKLPGHLSLVPPLQDLASGLLTPGAWTPPPPAPPLPARPQDSSPGDLDEGAPSRGVPCISVTAICHRDLCGPALSGKRTSEHGGGSAGPPPRESGGWRRVEPAASTHPGWERPGARAPVRLVAPAWAGAWPAGIPALSSLRVTGSLSTSLSSCWGAAPSLGGSVDPSPPAAAAPSGASGSLSARTPASLPLLPFLHGSLPLATLDTPVSQNKTGPGPLQAASSWKVLETILEQDPGAPASPQSTRSAPPPPTPFLKPQLDSARLAPHPGTPQWLAGCRPQEQGCTPHTGGAPRLPPTDTAPVAGAGAPRHGFCSFLRRLPCTGVLAAGLGLQGRAASTPPR